MFDFDAGPVTNICQSLKVLYVSDINSIFNWYSFLGFLQLAPHIISWV